MVWIAGRPVEGRGSRAGPRLRSGAGARALGEQGCANVLGVDRWPDFVAASTSEVPIVAHDLSLPMPFLASASFDGVLSHYALDYVSPICLRQILREARRVLVPGGMLVAYLASVGLGGGDESRTVAYTPSALRDLLGEAGFAEIEVRESSEGRNAIATARRGFEDEEIDRADRCDVTARVEGDTEVSAAFAGESEAVRFEVAGRGRTAAFVLELPPPTGSDENRVSICVRAVVRAETATELQICIWRGTTPVAVECARLEFAVAELSVTALGSRCLHASVWSPRDLSLEAHGSAHLRFDELPPGDTLSVRQRGEEGRRVVVEGVEALPSDAAEQLAPGRNRFLIRRAARLDVDTADRAWLAGRLHGIAVGVEEIEQARVRELVLWAGQRQSLVYLDGMDWHSMLSAVSAGKNEPGGPLILVDPALSDNGPGVSPPLELIDFVAANDRRFALLGAESLARLDPAELATIRRHLLLGGPPGNDGPSALEATENLRYLSERTLLMRLRQAHGFSPAEIGRRPSTA